MHRLHRIGWWHRNASRITVPFWGASFGHRYISPTKGQWCGALTFSLPLILNKLFNKMAGYMGHRDAYVTLYGFLLVRICCLCQFFRSVCRNTSLSRPIFVVSWLEYIAQLRPVSNVLCVSTITANSSWPDSLWTANVNPWHDWKKRNANRRWGHNSPIPTQPWFVMTISLYTNMYSALLEFGLNQIMPLYHRTQVIKISPNTKSDINDTEFPN